MSEGREDANWDTAQQTHREIQEEILHSRNLELFEDVEPLLPYGKVPECIEQVMPVDRWDPEDQKLKRHLPVASDRSETKPVKTQRGHEIPDGAHDGFKSVAELLRDAGKSLLSKGKAKKRDRPPVESEDEEEEVEEDLELLYGHSDKSKASSKKVKKAVLRSAKTTVPARKKVKSIETTQTSVETEEEEQSRREKEEKEDFNRSAQDFFNTEAPPIRHVPSPPITPPSSPPRPKLVNTPLPPSPITDESLPQVMTKPARSSNLTPRTAAVAGFSQIASVDLSWEEEEDRVKSTPSIPASYGERVRHIGLARPKAALNHAKSSEAMPPPLIPVHLSSPTTFDTPVHQAAQFPVRRAGRRAGPVILSSAEKPPAPSDSPLLPANRLRRRHADDNNSSPGVAPPARRSTRRAPVAQVKELVSLSSPVFDRCADVQTARPGRRCLRI